jgi:hypothetical protein
MVKHLRVITPVLIVAAAAVLATAAAALAAPQSARGRGPRGPHGLHGRWRLVFDDEFSGRSLNQSVWNAHIGWTNQNHVTDSLSNLSVRDGHLVMWLASPASGSEIETNRFGLHVGEYAEARIEFSGDGQTVFNWPAWWISGPDWPAAGENDIAEGLGDLTINYHYPGGSLETGSVQGTWAGHFHTYGIYRGRFYSRVYWDGRLVRTYRTDDNGLPETLWLTMGAANVLRTGASGEMTVDYVRAWAPA